MDFATSLWLFFVLVLGIIVVPGMDMMFVLANALTLGRRAGLLATVGLMLGGAAHTVIGSVAVAGLSTLIPSIATPMTVIGSAYMMWIGFSLVRSSVVVGSVERAAQRSARAIVLQALLTSILNPKAWLFVMAVFPQFMRAENGPFWVQGLALGLITVVVQSAVYGGLGLAAARGRDALVSNPALTVRIGRSAGWLLVAVAGYMLAAEAVVLFRPGGG
jgi:threonine/homoserine/homoserine lactone efflux protein